MNDPEKTKDETQAAGKEWAVLPFDEKQDDERWDKLISETDELAEKAVSTESGNEEILTEESLPDNLPVTNSAKTEDEKLAEMNPF